MTLIIDGVKFQPYEVKDEKQLEEFVEQYSKEFFGEESVYFPKKKLLSSLSGVAAIPDAFVVSYWGKPTWYIVEVELSSHPIHDHIVTQISKFRTALTSPETRKSLRNYMHEEIRYNPIIESQIKNKFGEVYKFLSELIDEDPRIVIVIDKRTPELDDVIAGGSLSNVIVRDFKTFERDGVGISVHAHIFDPLFTSRVSYQSAPPTSLLSSLPTKAVEGGPIPTISRSTLRSLPDGELMICPSRPEGVNFLRENNAWGFVRPKRTPRYFALYVSHPVAAVKYFGEIGAIVDPKAPESTLRNPEEYDTYTEGKKLVLLKQGTLSELSDPITPGIRHGFQQNLWYTTLGKFISAATLDDTII